jgi:hypothetical protein
MSLAMRGAMALNGVDGVLVQNAAHTSPAFSEGWRDHEVASTAG